MNMSVEKKKYPSALPTNWPTREEATRKSQNQLSSTGKVDVYYYRYVHHLGNLFLRYTLIVHGLQKPINALCFTFATYRSQLMLEHTTSLILTSLMIRWIFFSSRGVRNDASLVPPIRQTASIFKQPVTIYKTQEGKVKDIKHGNQEKPKQVGVCYLFFLSVHTHPVIKVLQRVLSIFSNLHNPHEGETFIKFNIMFSRSLCHSPEIHNVYKAAILW